MAAWQAMQAMIDIDGDHLQGMSRLGWLTKMQTLQTGLARQAGRQAGRQAACIAREQASQALKGLTTGSNMPIAGVCQLRKGHS